MKYKRERTDSWHFFWGQKRKASDAYQTNTSVKVEVRLWQSWSRCQVQRLHNRETVVFLSRNLHRDECCLRQIHAGSTFSHRFPQSCQRTFEPRLILRRKRRHDKKTNKLQSPPLVLFSLPTPNYFLSRRCLSCLISVSLKVEDLLCHTPVPLPHKHKLKHRQSLIIPTAAQWLSRCSRWAPRTQTLLVTLSSWGPRLHWHGPAVLPLS